MSTRRLLGENLTSAGVVNGVIQDDWDQIIKICNAGRAQDFYSVGDKKAVSFGSEGTINMIIAGFNRNILADLSKMANVTWTPENLLASNIRDIFYQDIDFDGWKNSKLRKYCNETILNSLQDNVKKNIKLVKIVSCTAINSAWHRAEDSDDKIWIPDYSELPPLSDSQLKNPWAFSTIPLGTGTGSGKCYCMRSISNKQSSTYTDYFPLRSTSFSTLGCYTNSTKGKTYQMVEQYGKVVDGGPYYSGISSKLYYLCPCFCL